MGGYDSLPDRSSLEKFAEQLQSTKHSDRPPVIHHGIGGMRKVDPVANRNFQMPAAYHGGETI